MTDFALLARVPRATWAAWVLALSSSFGAGCGADEGSSSTEVPTECPAGFELDPNGDCTLTGSTCPAGEIALLDPPGCKPVGWRDCPAGFVATPEGRSCEAIHAQTCGPFERPELGSTACVSVGFTECPPGFTLQDGTCTDVLPAAPCAGATHEVLGQVECQPIGDCTAPFPPAGATLFVDDSFGPGELDATHFLTIAGAMAVAASGDVIAVEAGTYVEGISAAPGVTVTGRCAESVVVTSATGTTSGFFASGTGTRTVSGITLSGHARGIVSSAGAVVHAREVLLASNVSLGVLATGGGAVTLEDSAIRDTLTDVGETFGYGVEVNSGGSVVLLGTSISNSVQLGVQVVDGSSSLVLDRSIVRGTQSKSNGDAGLGLLVRKGANVEVTESAIVENREGGILALNPGTEVTVVASVIRDTAISSAGYGRGLDVALGAAATVARTSVLDSHVIGVAVSDPGSAVTLERVSIAGTQTTPSGVFGDGLYAGPGVTVAVTDSAIVGSGDEAVLAEGAATVVSIERSLLAGSAASPTAFGRGLSTYGARVDVAQTAITDHREAGVLASEGAQLVLTDSLILRTAANQAGVKGRGVVAIQGAALSMRRVAVAESTEFGLFADGPGTTLSVEDVAITRTAPRPSDQRFGRGIGVQAGAAATLMRVGVTDHHEVAVFASGAGTSLELRDSFVARTAALPSGAFGLGTVVQNGATATVVTSSLEDHRVAGVFVAGSGSTASIIECAIERTALGNAESPDLAIGAVATNEAILRLSRVTVRDGEGIGAAFAGASGTLDACLLADNRVGLHVQEAALIEVEVIPDVPMALDVSVSTSTLFTGNEAKLGAGTVPVPNALSDVE